MSAPFRPIIFNDRLVLSNILNHLPCSTFSFADRIRIYFTCRSIVDGVSPLHVFPRWEKVKRRVLGGNRISGGVGIVANARFPSSFPYAIIHNRIVRLVQLEPY